MHTHTAHTPPAAAHAPVRLRTTQEWLEWFTATAGTLNADEFNLIMEEMQSSAEEMVTLVRCTRLAAESAAEIEAPAAPPPLAGDRLEKVQALFKAWDYEGKGSIDRLKVGASSVSFGPHKSHVLKQLDDMDTDGDNLITLVEMTDFFQASPSLPLSTLAALAPHPPPPRPGPPPPHPPPRRGSRPRPAPSCPPLGCRPLPGDQQRAERRGLHRRRGRDARARQ